MKDFRQTPVDTFFAFLRWVAGLATAIAAFFVALVILLGYLARFLLPIAVILALVWLLSK